MNRRTAFLLHVALRRALPILAATTLIAAALLGLGRPAAAEPDIVSITKTGPTGPVCPGAVVQYTVVINNTDATPVTVNVVQDTLPAGFAFSSMGAGSDVAFDPTPTIGTIVWTLSPGRVIAAGGSLRLVYNVVAGASPRTNPYTNSAQAQYTGGTTGIATADVTISGPAVTVTKTPSRPNAELGDPLLYTVVVRNQGNQSALIHAITDVLPAGFQFQSMAAGPLPSPSVAGNTLIWTLATPITLNAAGEFQFSYWVIANGSLGQVKTNTVGVSYTGTTCSGSYNATGQSSVTLVKERVFLPLLARIEPPPPPVSYRLAVSSRPGDNFEILAVDADGTDLVNVSNYSGLDEDPTWSPDGSRLAWVQYIGGSAEIVSANADGTNFVRLTNNSVGDRAPDWSPAGNKIAFHSLREGGRWEVYVMNTDGSGVVRLTDRARPSHDPVWSPDGSKIAFLVGEEDADLFVMNADGSNQVRLTNDPEKDITPRWSPDGTKIAFAKYREPTRRDIYVVNVSGGSPVRLTNNGGDNYWPTWSPDGTKIAGAVWTGSSIDIVTMNPDGSGLVNLTNWPGLDDRPEWSSDGTKIAFRSTRDGNLELYVMNANGTGVFRLSYTSEDEGIHVWHP